MILRTRTRSWAFFVMTVMIGLGAASYVTFHARGQQRAGRTTIAVPQRVGGGEVHGYVVANLAQWKGTVPASTRLRGGALQFLPDITAYLKNTQNGTISLKVKTDLKGFFMVPKQPAGRYQLCLEAPGYVSICPQTFTIASSMVFLPPAAIEPKLSFVLGSVVLANGRPCRFSDAAFGVDFDTKVSVDDDRGTQRDPVRANFQGLYLVPGVSGGTLKVRADCEAASAVKSVFLPVRGAGFANMAFPNQPPSVATLVARQGGRAIRRASPGATLEVTADAQDGDALLYTWAVSGSATAFDNRNTRTVKWTLPASPGLHSIYVLVRDGRGGVSMGRRDVSTDASSLLFTGTVTEARDKAIEGAEVEVNGVRAEGRSSRELGRTKTNARGAFLIAVKEESDRYVLTIRKPGYQIFSKVLTGPIVGGRYELVAVSRSTFEARQGGRIVERGNSGCSTESKTFEEPQVAERSPSHRSYIPGRCGAEVLIRPGSLVDPNGKRVEGNVAAFVSSIDLRNPNRFPGQYGGISSDGREVGINSVGAVDVSLFDSAGQPLSLASGSTATVRIPVDPLQLGMPGMPPMPPPTVPIWFYDSKTGIWVEEGIGKLAGDFYEAEVVHFSTINADFEFGTPACMRVHTDITKIPIPFQLRVSIPAAAPVKVTTATIDDPLSVIVLLPENTDIKLEVLDSAGNPIQTATTTGHTNLTSSPASPAYDYASCTSDVTLTLVVPPAGGLLDYFGNDAIEADQYYEKIDPTSASGAGTVSSAGTTVTGVGTSFNTFLEAGHLIRAGGQARTIQTVTNATTLTTETAFSPAIVAGTTYEKVGVKQTLSAWKTANAFGADDEDAVYLNAADLGLGRWMHKKKDPGTGNIAYYVSNYGVPPANGSVDIAALAKYTNDPNLGLIATVAMEYSPHPTGGGRYTKFYVYLPTGARVNKADLDGNGAKYIPRLCMVCHGGDAATVVTDPLGNAGARFIPFDGESFGYTGLDDPAAPGTFPLSRPNQEPEFKEMNRGVKLDTNVSAAIQELIEGWYGGALLPSVTQNDGYVHKGWRLAGTGTPPGTSPVSKATVYSQVIKPSCRSCHNTRDSSAGSNISWDAWDGGDGFKSNSLVKPWVCGPFRVMPHAKVTYNNFWLSTSPHRPAVLGNAGVDGWAPTDPCPP